MKKVTEIELDKGGLSWNDFERLATQELKTLNSERLKVRAAYINKKQTQLIMECEETTSELCDQRIRIISGPANHETRLAVINQSNALYNSRKQINCITSEGPGNPVIMIYEE